MCASSPALPSWRMSRASMAVAVARVENSTQGEEKTTKGREKFEKEKEKDKNLSGFNYLIPFNISTK